MDILKLAEKNQQIGWKVLEDTRIISTWESIGATVNIIGSLKTGLMMKKLDIDMHIYSDKLDIAKSFSVLQQLAEKLPLKEIQYRNLIDTEEECLEWHALYEDKDKNNWKLDMIHIRKGSKYDGFVERVTEAISSRLTPETRKAILEIKSNVPLDVVVPGIEIYHAVFAGGVRSYNEFMPWREDHPLTNSMEWIP
ncbi:hypothetical protein [Dysgonomonas macrotermitis]|uniref:Phosphoglycerate mutase family protein n=1 Tax=Dysgonomonas macrotermitis TaxID=1346286 RepID=A0A1M4T3I2_9BACT|nr:hypothetical protein [Dysgonomonas macrotermitis]SHE39001.1 hypothetical protein SAMN05444362_101227 [Dysgonomonas macrotermitis]